jgi:putative Mg2+ transporter-C (MgtC) family protein
MEEMYAEWAAVMTRQGGISLLVALVLGGMVGIQREISGHEAGFRTNTLVCVGSALAMLVSIHMHEFYGGDAGRIAAQVISGIGFLGAGTILVTERQEIKGATTAAGLWTSACMGLAIGVGFYEGALIAFVLIILTMRVLYLIEQNLVENSRDMILYIDFASLDDLNGIISHIKSQGSHIYEVDINRGHNEISRHPSAVFTIRLDKKVSHIQILKAISELGSVLFVDEL